jgi:hypothetical protein
MEIGVRKNDNKEKEGVNCGRDYFSGIIMCCTAFA